MHRAKTGFDFLQTKFSPGSPMARIQREAAPQVLKGISTIFPELGLQNIDLGKIDFNSPAIQNRIGDMKTVWGKYEAWKTNPQDAKGLNREQTGSALKALLGEDMSDEEWKIHKEYETSLGKDVETAAKPPHTREAHGDTTTQTMKWDSTTQTEVPVGKPYARFQKPQDTSETTDKTYARTIAAQKAWRDVFVSSMGREPSQDEMRQHLINDPYGILKPADAGAAGSPKGFTYKDGKLVPNK
jgi:hypothetical protein